MYQRPMEFFNVEHTDGQARAGVLKTTHSTIQTPVFMPVGTRGAVKSLSQHDLDELGPDIILGNTYHLYLRPGHDLIEKVGGGLHGFMGWNKSILTDSGGFQVFSLSGLNKIMEEGVRFQSHLDGSYHLIGPEKSMEIQKALGSDIVMAFDDCPALPNTTEKIRDALERTIRWAKRCKDYGLKPHQNLFGIVQGGLDLSLRVECLERLDEIGFPGMAIGGLSVGEKNDEMVELLTNFTPKMPAHKPRYLMGVGTPLDILNAVKTGVDMFDCVLPTRNARNGQVITSRGPLNIKNQQFKEDEGPLDPNCSCKVCRRYSRSYIRHLYNVGEYTAGQLITYHNIHFYLNMMREIRAAILSNKFDEYYEKFYKNYNLGWKN